MSQPDEYGYFAMLANPGTLLKGLRIDIERARSTDVREKDDELELELTLGLRRKR